MNEHWPEWKYVVVTEKKEKGNSKIQCCFCDMVFVAAQHSLANFLYCVPKSYEQLLRVDKVTGITTTHRVQFLAHPVHVYSI